MEENSHIFDQTESLGEEEKIKKHPVKDMFDNFDYEAALVDDTVKKYGTYLKNARTLSKHKHLFASFRQSMVTMKRNAADLNNKYNRTYIKHKGDIYLQYKLGTKAAQLLSKSPMSGISKDQIMPKNDFERKLFTDSDSRDMQYIMDRINTHMDFLDSSIKSIDHMLYGFDLVLKLEEYFNL